MREKLLAFVSWTWSHTDSLTKWLQIIAIFSAGIWAYHHFSITERPGLENRLSVDSGLAHQLLSPDSCLVNFTTVLENKGIASVEVEAGVVRAWAHTLPVAEPQVLTYLDLQNIEEGCPVTFMLFGDARLVKKYLLANGQYDSDAVEQKCQVKPRPFSKNTFLAKYPPGAARNESYDWLMRPQRQQVYLFRIDVLDNAGRPLGWGQKWDSDVCVPKPTPSGKETGHQREALGERAIRW